MISPWCSPVTGQEEKRMRGEMRREDRNDLERERKKECEKTTEKSRGEKGEKMKRREAHECNHKEPTACTPSPTCTSVHLRPTRPQMKDEKRGARAFVSPDENLGIADD